jgi:hypothetical protein
LERSASLRSQDRARHLTFVAITVALGIAFLEGLSVTVSWLFPGLVSNPEDHLDEMGDFDAYRDFVDRVYNPVTGWENPRSHVLRLGSVSLTTDAGGARRTPVEGEVRALFVGDSYTLGVEVDDFADYPSVVARRLDVPVANYGVSGFCPHQATLLLEQKAPLHPSARVAVLGIMYENVRRIRNGYRAALYVGTSPFQYKPWLDVRDGEVVARPNANVPPAESAAALVERARRAFRSDYYAPEPARFPYLLSVVRGFGRPTIGLRIGEALRPTYEQYYSDAEYARIMEYAVERFIAVAERAGLRPLVVFLPNNPRDLTSPGPLVEATNARHGALYALDAGDMDIDWERYNVRPGHGHPSAYGQARIAAFLAPSVRDLLAGERPRGPRGSVLAHADPRADRRPASRAVDPASGAGPRIAR